MAIFTNQATLSYNDTVTNSNIVTGEIIEVLSVTKTAIVPRYDSDSAITYIINITNSGNTAFTGLTVTDDLGAYLFGTPAEERYPLDYVTGSIRYFVNGELQAAPTVTDEQPLTISGISVPAQGNVAIIYVAETTAFAPLDIEGFITNEVVVSGGGLSAPIRDTETVTAEIEADLTITKAISPSTVTENGILTYTLTVLNNGNQPADAEDDIVITDTFDPILSDITVRLNGVILNEGVDYTYNESTGAFATIEGRITVPAASFTQDENGQWIVEPGAAVLTITGTV